MNCKICGGDIIGDGYTIVLHCENVELDLSNLPEPDSNIIYCKDNSYGKIMGEKIRAKCNNMTYKEREERLKRALEIIYGKY